MNYNQRKLSKEEKAAKAKLVKSRRQQTDRLLVLMGRYFECWFVVKLEGALRYSSTHIHPVIECSDRPMVDALIDELYTVRANTYNKLGSTQGWGISWMGSQRTIANTFGEASTYTVQGKPLPSKLFEWTVQDTVKNILAQQEAAKVAIIKLIYKRHPLIAGEKLTKEDKAANKVAKVNRKALIDALDSVDEIKANPWLHRVFRAEYCRGHCQQNRQIVVQQVSYKCTRVSRYQVRLEVQGLEKGKRYRLLVKSPRIIKGQIRIIRNDSGGLEIHSFVTLYNRDYCKMLNRKAEMGIDRGHTEVFYTSDGESIGDGFGQHLNRKTDRITRNGRRKNKLWALANVRYAQSDPAKAKRIIDNNLGRKTELKRRGKDDAYVLTTVNHSCRVATSQADELIVESLIEEIKSSKALSRRAANRLAKWEKGTVIDRLTHWSRRQQSSVTLVSASYTSQVDHRNGTLLGNRKNGRFTTFDGDVFQDDDNAAKNVLARKHDEVITRYMPYRDVQGVLLRRTASFLAAMGLCLNDAFNRGWLDVKHKRHKVATELLLGS